MTWFGEPWPSAETRAPVCGSDAEQVSTPVGDACLHCDEEIADGDRGTLMPYLGPTGSGARPVHVECLGRMTLGGPAHLMGLCACHGTDGDVGDPDLGLSPRAAALLVWETTRQT